MDPQLVDFGASLGGSLVILGFLWRAMARLTRRLDQQGKDLAELKTDMAGLKGDVVGLKEGQARTDGNILRIVGDLGVVKGELKRIAPTEKVASGGS